MYIDIHEAYDSNDRLTPTLTFQKPDYSHISSEIKVCDAYVDPISFET